MITYLLTALLASTAAHAENTCLKSLGVDGVTRDVCVGSVVGAGLRHDHSRKVGQVVGISINGSYADLQIKIQYANNSLRAQSGAGDVQIDHDYVRVDADGLIQDNDDVAVLLDACVGSVCKGDLALIATQSSAYKIVGLLSNGQALVSRNYGQGSSYSYVIPMGLAESSVLRSSGETLKVGETVVTMPENGYIGFGTIQAVTKDGYRVKTSALSSGSSMSCDGGKMFRDNSVYNFSEKLNDTFKYKSNSGMYCQKTFFRESATVTLSADRVSKRVMCIEKNLCRGQWISFSTAALGFASSSFVKGWIQYAGQNGLTVVRFIANDGNIEERAVTLKALRANGLIVH